MKPEDHPQVASGRIGVLLINLGTPDAPTPPAVRRYLGEFLSDRCVVEIPPIAWQPILRGIILNTRPKKSAHAYRLVWTEHGSPLARYTRIAGAEIAVRVIFRTVFCYCFFSLPLPWPVCPLWGNEYPFIQKRIVSSVGMFFRVK